MTVTLIICGVLLVGWVLLNLKTSRPDGKLIGGVHKYRRMMWYIMPTRNESVVYYDTHVVADNLLAYLKRVNPQFHCDITHATVGAVGIAFLHTPKMNRFVIGRRLYQRDGVWISFSMKRKKGDEDAKLAAVKLKLDPQQSFKELCLRIGGDIIVQRSDVKTGHDKEYDLLTAIPRPLLNFGVGVFRWLDYHNILPGSFIESDPIYTSSFIANLGSVGMNAGFHHLYEWGTSALFMMVGKIEERAMVVDGQVVPQKILPIRWSYDERVDDGLSTRRGILAANAVLSDPARFLGCTAEDGSDTFALGQVQIPDELLRSGN